jgi:hypothetical protein
MGCAALRVGRADGVVFEEDGKFTNHITFDSKEKLL